MPLWQRHAGQQRQVEEPGPAPTSAQARQKSAPSAGHAEAAPPEGSTHLAQPHGGPTQDQPGDRRRAEAAEPPASSKEPDRRRAEPGLLPPRMSGGGSSETLDMQVGVCIFWTSFLACVCCR